MALSTDSVIFLIVLATLAAIVWSLRILVTLERRIANIDGHIEKLVQRVIHEEERIEAEESKIEQKLGIGAKTARAPAKPKAKKKSKKK